MSSHGHNEFQPDYAVSPGAMLQEWLEENGQTQVYLALRTGRSRKMVNELIQGVAPVTAETAIQLERVTNVPASMWSNLEMNYRGYLARKHERETLGQLKGWVKRFSYNKMAAQGWIPDARETAERASHLLTYFGVASPEQWEEIYGCVEGLARQSPTHRQDLEDLSAWLRQGELLAANRMCLPYDEAKFRRLLAELRTATTADLAEQLELLSSGCSQAGVVFLIVPELPKTRISGFTRWLPRNKALIQQSLRHKRNDHLWFTFFHEAAHILLHGKKERFLEFERPLDNPKEHEANQWAADFLIPRKEWERFVREYKGRFYNDVVITFAREMGIAPGIVAGRLQHEGLASHKWYKELFVRVDMAKAM